MTTKSRALGTQYFYFAMTLLIAALVVYGFSFTMGANIIHPTVPRPRLLYVHAVIFFGWLIFFIVQSALVRSRNVRTHRTLGWFGVALGATITVLGVSTAITMTRFKIVQLHSATAASDMIIPLWDMVAFTVTFALAIFWRKKPEYHRRLMLVATCSLAAAGFRRYPVTLAYNYFYGGVDLLILLGVARDLIANRRIHPVYLVVLPVFLVCQSFVIYTANHTPTWWARIAHTIIA